MTKTNTTICPPRAEEGEFVEPRFLSRGSSAHSSFSMRAAGFLLSRAEFVHRCVRDVYRTRTGYLLVWANVILWSLYLLTEIAQ